MVFDEATEEDKPRHGKGKTGEDKKGPWIMLGNNSKGTDWDPYAERLESKKAQKEKQKMQEERNVQEAAAAGYKGPLTVSGKLASHAKEMDRASAKEKLSDTLAVVQRS